MRCVDLCIEIWIKFNVLKYQPIQLRRRDYKTLLPHTNFDDVACWHKKWLEISLFVSSVDAPEAFINPCAGLTYRISIYLFTNICTSLPTHTFVYTSTSASTSCRHQRTALKPSPRTVPSRAKAPSRAPPWTAWCCPTTCPPSDPRGSRSHTSSRIFKSHRLAENRNSHKSNANSWRNSRPQAPRCWTATTAATAAEANLPVARGNRENSLPTRKQNTRRRAVLSFNNKTSNSYYHWLCITRTVQTPSPNQFSTYI